jgi:hypothetical protein
MHKTKEEGDMDLISWGAGRIGDADKDGNLEFEIKGVKVLGVFTAPDLKIELPTAMIAAGLVSIGQRIPWANALGRILK